MNRTGLFVGQASLLGIWGIGIAGAALTGGGGAAAGVAFVGGLLLLPTLLLIRLSAWNTRRKQARLYEAQAAWQQHQYYARTTAAHEFALQKQAR